MKTIRLIFFTCAFILTLKLSFSQTKRALIFAIGNYPEESGWPVISSIRDDALVKKALEDQQFSDIKIVPDKEATIRGIKNALNELITRSGKGDIVVIHFSAHGEQVEDLNGNKPDGLEESIVGYDAKQPPYGTEPTKAEVLRLRQGYFTDDVFGQYVDQLRAKLGRKGDVVIFLDLCYAGTGTRGVARVRGGRAPLVSPGFYARRHAGTNANKVALPLGVGGDMASYVVIGASRANEADNETFDDTQHPIGPLSYSIGKVFARLDPGMTYRSLFAGIQSVMNEKLPQQHPVLSGDGQDRRLFGGSFVAQKPYLLIGQIKGKDLTVKGGQFAGLDVGAKVAIYPAGTASTSESKPLASGTVISAGPYEAKVQLDADPGLKQPAMGWVFITGQVFNTAPLKVGIEGNPAPQLNGRKPVTAFSPNEAARIQKALKSLPGVRLSAVPELTIARGTNTAVDSIFISATRTTFDTIKNASKDTSNLKNKIRAYLRYSFLKNLNITDPGANLEVKLLPVVNGQPDTAFIHLNDTSFSVGEQLMLWIKNKSKKPLYVNILDLQPDGAVNAILPNRSQRIFADDLLIPGGGSFLFKNYAINVYPPCGKEIFKIFASNDKIDLEDIATPKGDNKRGNLRPFERLVDRGYGVRGGDGESVSNANGSSYNLYFDIKPKP